MLILPCDVSVCVTNHLLLWHWVCPWPLGGSVQVGSRSQWESVQGEACSAQPRPAHIFFYLESTENASFPTTYLLHPQGTWLKSCICWGSIKVRTMNSGFNNCERDKVLCFQRLYLCVLIHCFIILKFNCNIILFSAEFLLCSKVNQLYTLFF